MEEKYVNLEEALHRISDLRITRDNFDEYYGREHEILIFEIVEAVNETIEQCIKILCDESENENFTVVVTKDR